MKRLTEMALESGCKEHIGVIYVTTLNDDCAKELKAFVELIRADERSSWPAEMEAMERQVIILTDVLNDRQRWFDALEAQHKQAILAEREACAKFADQYMRDCEGKSFGVGNAIRARSNT